MNSAEDAGGTAHGVAFKHIITENTIDDLEMILTATGKWVKKNANTFLGHVKMSIDAGDRGAMTMNLTDLGTGVERHGSIEFPAESNVRFMSAVLDVDHGELAKFMESELERNGFRPVKEKKIIELR